MAEVKLKTFYPDNGPVDSAEINANNNALEGSLGSGDIDEENMRSEGIDFRNLSESLHIREVGQLNNGYQLSFGTLPATDARYNSYSVDTNEPKEVPLNHDDTGTTNTAISKGTKLRLNGTAGVDLAGNELISVNFNVNVIDNLHHTPSTELLSKLVDTTTKDGGSGATRPYGSGVGEWFWIIYPKFNVTSNSLTDSDFQTPKQAGLVDGTDFLDPSEITGINSISNNYFDFDERRWDHVTIIPELFVAASDVSTSPFIMKQCDKDGADNNNALGGPQNHYGTFTFKVKDDVAAGKKLFGIQLYISGYWRMHAQSAGGGIGQDIGAFLEYEICDPSRTNTDGDPIPLYGVEGAIAIERIQTSCIVHATPGA
jgi:hypothetical protein